MKEPTARTAVLLVVIVVTLGVVAWAATRGVGRDDTAPEGSSEVSTYEAPDGPGDPFFYNAIQYQHDQGDCEGLDSIIQGWREPPRDPYADSYIAEAGKAKAALGCP